MAGDKRGGGLGSRLRGHIPSSNGVDNPLKAGGIKNRRMGRTVRRIVRQQVRAELHSELLRTDQHPSARLPGDVIARSWHPVRSMLAVACADGSLHVMEWHAAAGHLESIWRTSDEVLKRCLALRWSEEGRSLCALTPDNEDLLLALADRDLPPPTWTHPPSDTSSDGLWRVLEVDGALYIRPTSARSTPR